MPKVILLCGRICSGKTTYARRLCCESDAVLLSVDEIMLALFGQHCGEMHDEYASRTKQYLLAKTEEVLASGCDVVLDWGFWQKAERDAMRSYFGERKIPMEFCYIDIRDAVWRERIRERNRAVEAGEICAYFVDENLAAKFAARFEEPREDEAVTWIG